MTKTRDDILAMQPGLEMDEVVAVELMGWTHDPSRCTHCWSKDGGKSWIHFSNIPRYSTDIAAAWEVLGELLKTHRVIFGKDCPDDPWEVGGNLLTEPYEADGFFVTAPAAPEAICKAALLAVIASAPATRREGGA